MELTRNTKRTRFGRICRLGLPQILGILLATLLVPVVASTMILGAAIQQRLVAPPGHCQLMPCGWANRRVTRLSTNRFGADHASRSDGTRPALPR